MVEVIEIPVELTISFLQQPVNVSGASNLILSNSFLNENKYKKRVIYVGFMFSILL